MFEKNEWWIILLAIVLGAWYFLKKGQTPMTANSFKDFLGSIVNPTQEPGAAQPAQTTTPVVFRPAQPSSGSQLIRIGTFMNVPGPAQNIPVTRFNLYGYPGATYGGAGSRLA